MESDVLHMMSPYRERVSGRAPSEIVVSDTQKNSIISEKNRLCKHPPRVLDHKPQVVVSCEPNSFLYVLRRPCIDADYRHISLLTRNTKCGVEVAALDRPVGKGVRLVVGIFGSTGLIRTPGTVVPADEDVSAVSCGGVVAWGGRWDGADQWLRDFRCEGLELGIRRPTS